MAKTLAEIRAKLQAQETRSNSGPRDNVIFPHWNINENDQARLRFLPDGNSENTFFWVERNIINLPFAGIKGQPDSRPVTVQVPCVEMWGEPCPILAEVRPWFKDKSLEDMGRKYWKKKSYLFQGFVRENPIGDDTTPADTIRRFIISPQIFALIKSALMDPDMEELPTDYNAGLDFVVAKTTKGGYSDYTTSKWARRESALTEDERASVDANGLYDLRDFLPKRPTADDLRVMKEMFEASVDGLEYDPDAWANFYRPRGVDLPGYDNNNTTATATPPKADPAPAATAQPAVQEAAPAKPAETPPWDDNAEEPEAAAEPVTEPQTTSKRAEDILSIIRNRQNTSQ